MPARFDDPYYLSCLQEMGLTHHEALVYSILVSLGPSHAKKVSEVAKLAREHSYEILRKLEGKGLVELVLARSSWYVAVEPRVAVNSFVTKITDHTLVLTEKAYDVGAWLQHLKDESARLEESAAHPEPHIRLVFGRNVMQEFEKELKACQSEYRGVLGFSSTVSPAGLHSLELLAAAARRKLQVRIITTEGAVLNDSVRKLTSEMDVRIHESAGMGARFSVFDGSRVIMALHEPLTSREEARVICSDNSTFARGFALHFEQLWAISAPVQRTESGRRPPRVSKAQYSTASYNPNT